MYCKLNYVINLLSTLNQRWHWRRLGNLSLGWISKFMKRGILLALSQSFTLIYMTPRSGFLKKKKMQQYVREIRLRCIKAEWQCNTSMTKYGKYKSDGLWSIKWMRWTVVDEMNEMDYVVLHIIVIFCLNKIWVHPHKMVSISLYYIVLV